MSIVAGLLVQNALKHLLHFGQVSYYLGYSAMTNFFPSDVVKPNPECTLAACCDAQREYAKSNWKPQEWIASSSVKDKEEVVHKSNEWGITVEEDIMETSASNGNTYDIGLSNTGVDNEYVVQDTDESLEELMLKLNSA